MRYLLVYTDNEVLPVPVGNASFDCLCHVPSLLSVLQSLLSVKLIQGKTDLLSNYSECGSCLWMMHHVLGRSLHITQQAAGIFWSNFHFGEERTQTSFFCIFRLLAFTSLLMSFFLLPLFSWHVITLCKLLLKVVFHL